jgi:hypothetical protein
MATTETEQLRELTDGAVGFDDAQLQAAIDAQGGVKPAAIYIWRVKAASSASLIDVSESGSSRSMGDLHKQYLTMADSLAKEVAAEVVLDAGVKTTRRIVRR